MNKKNSCIACRYNQDGVKTRKALVHTCGKYMEYIRPELPNIDTSKKYILGADLYDYNHGEMGAICVMSKNEDGQIIVEYSTRTKPEDFDNEIERIAKYFNADIWRTEN